MDHRKQGHIQKKRDDDLIAHEIEALMFGDVPELDETPPTTPQNIALIQDNGRTYLTWNASEDEDKGSWVVQVVI